MIQHAEKSTTVFRYKERGKLSPRLRLLCLDLAGQVEGIAQGTGLDADLWAYLLDSAVLEDGFQLVGWGDER